MEATPPTPDPTVTSPDAPVPDAPAPAVPAAPPVDAPAPADTPAPPADTPAPATPPDTGTGTIAEPPAPAPPPQTTDQSEATALLHQLIEQQTQQRAEIAQLRKDVATGQRPATTTVNVVLSDEERVAERLREVEGYSHYCPGCGRLYNYPRECEGYPAAPHAPIEVVSTDELSSDNTDAHTPAPPAE